MRFSIQALVCIAFCSLVVLTSCDESAPTGPDQDATGAIYGDTTWVRAIEHVSGSLWPRAMVQAHDQGFVIVGLGGVANDTSHGFILKVDDEGYPLWYHDVGFGVHDIVQHPSGGYAIVGNSADPEVKVYLLSSNAEVQWSHAVTGKYGRGVAIGGYGEVLFTGTSTGGRVLQGSISSDGIQRWVRQYDTTSNDDRGISVASHGTGSVITGELRNQELGQREILLLETDDDGNELQRATFGEFLGDTGYRIRSQDDLGILIAGGMYTFDAGNKEAAVLRISQGFEEVFTTTFSGSSGDDYAFDMIVRNQTVVIAGDSDSELFLACVNLEDGAVAWKKTYPGAGQGCAIVKHPHGGLVAAGGSDSDGDGQYELYLFRCYSDGKMDKTGVFVNLTPVQ
ncbi:hypothetical protein KQI52_07050 [bacterium]|nr:hypothetical protein [bacterium]